MRTCRTCKESFDPNGAEKRCEPCREAARHKACRGCGSNYRDGSNNNTRRYCDECSPSAALGDDVSPEEKRRQRNRENQRRWAEQNQDYQKDWAQANPEKSRSYSSKWQSRKWREDPEYREQKKRAERERRRAKQREVIDHYGGRCACCGEAEPMFLTLDHVNGGGSQDRKKTGLRTWEIAMRAGFPDTFQVLCRNCNYAKYLNGGVCPHQES